MTPSIIAVILLSLLFAFLFLWAGIYGTLMIEALGTPGIVRDFTIFGGVVGGVVGVVGIWLRKKGKRHGRGK